MDNACTALNEHDQWRRCLRNPIPEISLAAKLLDAAVSAHFCGKGDLASSLIKQANIDDVGKWAYSLRGKLTDYNRPFFLDKALPPINQKERDGARMPSTELMRALHRRDGFHCRFCGVAVIARGVRKRLIKLYPDAVQWGNRNDLKHTSLDILEIQYDHVLPHSRGGRSDLENMVVTCNPCNYGRGEHTLEEMHLLDPRSREPMSSSWDGLERLLLSM